MPSSPKIPKEEILDTALKMLIRDGYSSINIKTVAKELGCSTQPISWQFGGMEGLRKELLEYCLSFLENRFAVKGKSASEIIFEIAKGYVSLAFDYPNLYKYLYMSDLEGKQMGEIARSLRLENHNRVIDMLKKEYGLSANGAKEYMMNLELYVHGVASYTATGFVFSSLEEIIEMIGNASDAFLAHAKTR